MKLIYILVFILGATLNGNAQTQGPRKVKGNGRVIEKERRLPEFDRIEISGNIDATILNNDFQKKIMVNGDINLQTLIKSKVENGTLYLTYNNNVIILSQTEPLKVRIPSKKIKEIVLKDGAKLTNLGAIETLQLKITSTDNSTADLRLKVDEVILDIENDSEIKLNGSANILKINYKGSKDFDAKELSNFFTEIELEGSGNVYTNTVNGIDGNINGTGNLYYKATKTVNVTDNGNGKAEKY
ncbi:DUF2807 domain-containing protein [Paenimyroides tangerinum]|uniref:DUF2807 domain-containing protein n=1 Tax=Paenimyroides tangerinum TaxID=2488728 RepID=A0A3P3WDQ4_9FLAO|nr:DUF2807 domain-containing protein [Paenimyroides tangerinum]RRJ93282.1 DUF2807 domain-containing protein [Paenimyroides tangerinum]